LIQKVGTEGNRYVLDNIPDSCKLLFLSSHVIFEGYENEFNITEGKEPKPLLSYGLSKRQSELDIINSGKNFIIARLASTYGHNLAFRLGIVVNVLSKMAAVDKKIKLFNKQLFKPLAGTSDIGRSLKFLGEGDYNKEIFHLVHKNMRVAEIVDIIKRYVPDLKIEEVLDNENKQGYTLSNDKILATGFKFRQHLESEMFRMIKMWEN
jgi:dTDP-4-dehydrorhamnose reductase